MFALQLAQEQFLKMGNFLFKVIGSQDHAGQSKMPGSERCTRRGRTMLHEFPN